MTDLSLATRNVIRVLCDTEEYKNYREKLDTLRKYPELLERANELRKKNFLIQKEAGEEILDMMDALTNEYEDVINNELVSDFMEAEVALAKLLQDFTSSVIEGLDFD